MTNSKTLLTVILALSLLDVGTLGILSMDSENSEGAVIVAGTVNAVQGEPCSFEIIDPSWAYNMGLSGVGFTFVSPGLIVESGVSVGYRPWSYNSSTHMVTFIPLSAGTFTVSAELWDADSGETGDESSFLLIVAPSEELQFTNPPSISLLVGDSLEYEPTTNLFARIEMESGPNWLSYAGSGLIGSATMIGTFTVVLKATSLEGPAQTATQTLTIHVFNVLAMRGSYDSQPLATTEFRYTPIANINATFTVSGLPEGAVWQNNTVRWVPISSGDYEFKVTATSTEGPAQTVTETVKLKVYPKLTFTSMPKAEIVIIPKGSVVGFYSMSTGATSVLWEFSDGQTSTEWYPEMTFSPGQVTAKLTAYNDLGSDSTETVLEIVGTEKDGMSLEQFWDDYWMYIVGLLGLVFAVLIYSRRV